MHKLVVVVAALLVVAVVAIGVWRPGGGRGMDPAHPGGGVAWLTGLLSAAQVRADQLRGQPCWDEEGRLTVPAGASCVTRLPADAKGLTLCLTGGALVAVGVRGSRYGAQPIDPASLACSGQVRRIDLYDEGSVLTVRCGPAVACRLRLR